MYFYYFFIVFSILLSLKPTEANETSCETSQKLFAKLCFTPKPYVTDLDFAEFNKNEPNPEKVVLYSHLGNDIEQLHISEVLKGKLLSPKDDFSDLCYHSTIEHGENSTGDGITMGYGNLTSGWLCKPSLDFHGAELCDYKSTLSKYHEDSLQYISYMDDETGFLTYITCYPNGQVGWGTVSKSPKLTEDEKDFALGYAEELGFPKDTHAVLYEDKCA